MSVPDRGVRTDPDGFDLDLRLGEVPAPELVDPETPAETSDTCEVDCAVPSTSAESCATADTCGGADCVLVTGGADTCGVTDETCDGECLQTAAGDTCGEACFTGDTCDAGTCGFTCLPESCELVPAE